MPSSISRRHFLGAASGAAAMPWAGILLLAIQGEPCAPIGARIKDRLRQKGPLMVFGYFGERNLYVPTREIVRENAYQAQVIQIQFGCPVGWAPEAEDEMVKAALAMFGEKYELPKED